MIVKVLKPFLVGNGIIATKGQTINVTDNRAKELERMGVAVPNIGGRGNPADAFTQRPIGGKTGAEKVAPSSPVVPPPSTSETILKKPRKKRKSSR